MSRIRERTPEPEYGGIPRPAASPEGDDGRLAAAAQNGDATAFGTLYDRHCARIYRLAYWRSGDDQVAQQITSATFTRALRYVASFTHTRGDFVSWLYTLARQVMQDRYGHKHFRLEISLPPNTDVNERPDVVALTTVDQAELVELVKKLPSAQQEFVALCYFGELSIKQTAEAMEITYARAQELNRRATRALALLLSGGVAA